MPIPGLTDRSASFAEVARLRKGKPKSEGLEDLTYFRMDWRPDLNHEQVKAMARFDEIYGAEPNHIKFSLAFRDLSRCWDANFRAYNKAGLLAQAGGIEGEKGLYFHYLRHNQTGEILVRDNRDKDGNLVPFDPEVPIYSYKNKKGQDTAVFAKPEGRLKMLLPELGLANFVLFMTHSWYDCAKISENLAGVVETAANLNLPLPVIPLILTRRWEKVSVTYGGTKRMEDRNLCLVDIDPEFSAPNLLLHSGMRILSLPAGQAIPAPPSTIPDDDPEDDPSWLEGEFTDPPATNPTPPNGTGKKAPLTVAAAAELKTPKGTPLGELDVDQLKYLAAATGHARLSEAAQMLLARPDSKALAAWSELAKKAKGLNLVFDPLPGDANNLGLYHRYGELADLVAQVASEPEGAAA